MAAAKGVICSLLSRVVTHSSNRTTLLMQNVMSNSKRFMSVTSRPPLTQLTDDEMMMRETGELYFKN